MQTALELMWLLRTMIAFTVLFMIGFAYTRQALHKLHHRGM
jgi:hypothetical protein